MDKALACGPATGAATEVRRETRDETRTSTTLDERIAATMEKLAFNDEQRAASIRKQQERLAEDSAKSLNLMMASSQRILEAHAQSTRRAKLDAELTGVLHEMETIWRAWFSKQMAHRDARAQGATTARLREACARLAELDVGDAQSVSSRKCGELMLALFVESQVDSATHGFDVGSHASTCEDACGEQAEGASGNHNQR